MPKLTRRLGSQLLGLAGWLPMSLACTQDVGRIDSGGVDLTNSLQVAPELVVDTIFDFGRIDDDPNRQLNTILDIQVDKAGYLYVVDDFKACARVFTPRGEIHRIIGGHGKGPGECGRPHKIALSGDTVLVQDGRSIHRFLVGKYIGSISIRQENREDAWELTTAADVVPTPAGLAITVNKRDASQRPASYAVRMLDSNAGALGPPIIDLPFPKTYPAARARAPLAAFPRVAVRADGTIFYVTGEAFAISRVGQRALTANVPRFNATYQDIEAELDARRADLEAFSAMTGKRPQKSAYDAISDLPRPKYRPVLGRLLASADGLLLVERLDISTRTEKQWILIDEPRATVIGRVQTRVGSTPYNGFSPYTLSGCELTGVYYDEFDAPHIVGLRICRPDSR